VNDLTVPIRRVARFVFFLFLILVAQLTYLQLIHASALENDPHNVRTLINKFGIPRGDIVTADNQVVATSVKSNDELKYQRQYPLGSLYGQITGYQSFLVGNTGVEKSYNKELTGLRGEEENVPRVVLTIRSDIQSLLEKELEGRTGAIVVMEAKTGSIVGMYANPAFDPTPIAGHDSKQVQEAFNSLVNDPQKPSVSRAYAERYAPGSTFKIVTASSALEAGIADADRKFPVAFSFTPPLTNRPIRNFGGGACGNTLQHAFQQSCNTVFARLGDELKDDFVPRMEKFEVGGKLVDDQNIGEQPPLDIPGAVGATGPLENSYKRDAPQFALAGIGQGRVALSPLSVALMTSAIANQGTIPTPHVVDHVEDGNGNIKKRIGLSPWKENIISVSTADTVRGFMEDVVQRGTGVRARLKSVKIAGKTGTAQVTCADGTSSSCPPHAWFTSFAPSDNPQYIVTVYIQKAESQSGKALTEDSATGGALAAPIAKSIYMKLFNVTK
jgi:peptidoglycan glycosyltransferase